MPAKPFTVRLNLDDIARGDIAATLPRQSVTGTDSPSTSAAATHHGAGDTRQAARERSGRARSGRAAGAGGGRSYAFRRS